MTKRKSTKRALLLSALSLLMCVSMLIGSTFAWFTDSVTSAGNKIQAGSLKIDLELLDKETGWNSIKESKTAIFDYDKWEPGYTDVKILKIENEGTLALKWHAKFVSAVALSPLADVIDVYVCPSAEELAYPADRNLSGYTKVGTVAEFVNTIEQTTKGNLTPKGTDGSIAYLGIALKMQETAGNEYQELTLGEFDIQILATQYTYEKDSFDDQYDAGAYLPTVYNISELKSAIADGKSVKLGADMTFTEADANNGNAIYYTGDKSITIDLGGHTITGSTSNALIRIQKAEGAENTINIVNGKLVADSNTWSAVSVGSSAATKTYVNMKNVEVVSSKANDMAIRARTGAEFTITDCKIVATDGAGGIVAGGGDITLNNVTVDQKGYYSNNWNSVALGVSGKGSLTVNSGSFTSNPDGASQGTWVAYIMNSGGNLTINGGTFNGTTGSAACGLICADTAAVVEINGGTFNSTGAILDMRNNTGGTNPKATLKGGNFSADPRISGLYASNLISVADGYSAMDNSDGTWTVVKGTPVNNPATLKETVKNGGDVLLTDDIAIAGAATVSPNGYTEAYGNKIGIAQYGGILDGNGKTLTDSEGDKSYVVVTHGGTIKNLTIKTGARGIVTYSPTENVYIDNVVVDGAGYALNSTEHGAVDMFVTNSTINGWTSLAGFNSVQFTNCKLGENSAKYWQSMGYGQDYDRLFRVYSPTTYTKCEFEQGYYLDMSAGGTATLIDCTTNGVEITAENYADYITIELPAGKTLSDCVAFG